MNRRDFIKGCAATAAVTALSGCAAAGEVKNTAVNNANNSGKPKSRARSVIEIWVWGGPSQVETFDPKPKAGKEYNNGLKAIPTNVPGIEISEMLPSE